MESTGFDAEHSNWCMGKSELACRHVCIDVKLYMCLSCMKLFTNFDLFGYFVSTATGSRWVQIPVAWSSRLSVIPAVRLFLSSISVETIGVMVSFARRSVGDITTRCMSIMATMRSSFSGTIVENHVAIAEATLANRFGYALATIVGPGWMDPRMYVFMAVCTYGSMDVWMFGCEDVWMHRCTDAGI